MRKGGVEILQLVLSAASLVQVQTTLVNDSLVADEIRNHGILYKFMAMMQQHNLTDYLRRVDITVFAPVSSSEGLFREDAARFGYDLSDPVTMRNILLCHIGDGVVREADMASRRAIRSFHPHYKYLYFNSYSYGDSKINSVNGAWVVGGDIEANNGFVHIIDRFLIPVQSKKPLAEFLENPDLPHLSFGSIKNASVIDPELRNATNSTSYSFTVFSPNDSYITNMPKFGQDRLFTNLSLLKTVFWAHVVEKEMMFIPRLGDLPSKAAKAGVIKFERDKSDVYVSNNKVRAKVIQANVPVANGVIHVIDDLLFFIYRNFRQKIHVMPNARTINASIARVDSSLQETFEASARKMTFFLPTDDAFAKLPTDKQMRLSEDINDLSKMLRDHFVIYAERDIGSLVDGERFTTRDGEVLIIHRENNEVYVEGGDIKARVTVADIGCTNGVIHLINSVLFQKDFTIWEAIKGNPQLSSMMTVFNENLELQHVLDSSNNGPMTVFLISDAEYTSLPMDTIEYLRRNSSVLKQAIKGSIAEGYITSSQVQDELSLETYGNLSIKLYHTNQGLYIIGSRIRANVIISDIWCSNGILHIVDNILHIPTRNILDEIRNRPSLSTIAGILQEFPDFQVLKNITQTFTMFVPVDEAFTLMPTYRARKLTNPYELKSIIKAHVIPGVSRYIEEFGEYNRYQSLHRTPIFVLKSQGQATAVSNNVKGLVTEGNIRCTNGMIHLVDTLLHFPYWTLAETIENTNELKQFYRIIEDMDGFDAWANNHDVQQTMFIPSEHFILGLSETHLSNIMSEPEIRKKLYRGHFLQDITLSQLYLDNEFQRTVLYATESRYNVTFKLRDRDPSGLTERTTVDIGYINLRRTFDAVRDGIGCSNGVIYIVDGFLNYPLHNIDTERKLQPKITLGADLLVKLIPKNSSIDLKSTATKFTVLIPSDDSFEYLEYDDIKYINENLTYTETMEIISRHIIVGHQYNEDAILNGKFNGYAISHNMSIVSTTGGLYIRWKDIEARIISTNILATNGIIHVIDRFLLSTPYQTTTILPTTAKTTRTDSSSSGAETALYSNTVMWAILCSVFVKQLVILVSVR